MTVRRIAMEIDIDESIGTDQLIGELKGMIKDVALKANSDFALARYEANKWDEPLHPDKEHLKGMSSMKCCSMFETSMPMDMGPRELCRFPTVTCAQTVAEKMRCLTDCNVRVVAVPVSEEEEKRGVGSWVITAHCRIGDSFGWHRMANCCDAALTLALADALRDVRPANPLLGIWHLRPENRSKLPKYKPI